MSIQNLEPTLANTEPIGLIPKILAIEPDPSLREILCDMLGSDGYHCKVVPDCEDIIKLVENFKPDIILIEYLLPSVNGGELCEQLKSDERFSGIPVILYSAYP
ncbi:MAG: response regulator, partial [Pedobacter sp.]